MKRTGICLALAVFALCLAGCAMESAKKNTMATFQWSSTNKRVLLVAPDVQLSELTAGGVTEPRADWTQAAQGFVAGDIKAYFVKKDAQLIQVEGETPHEVQLVKLHAAVGQAILTHLYNENLKLPNKGDALDWSLGPGTNEMRDRHGADYALFVFIRDSYSSDSRRALQVLGALAGVGLPGGVQIGFASLVDLRTGNIVWFNRLISGSGDLRTGAQAQATVDALIRNMPI
jgi:hypothetical protein